MFLEPGAEWLARNPLCFRPKSCTFGAWLGPVEIVGEAQDATWRAITPVCSRTCAGGQGEPLTVKKSRAHGAKIGGTRKVLVTPDASLSTPVAEATNHA